MVWFACLFVSCPSASFSLMQSCKKVRWLPSFIQNHAVRTNDGDDDDDDDIDDIDDDVDDNCEQLIAFHSVLLRRKFCLLFEDSKFNLLDYCNRETAPLTYLTERNATIMFVM